MIFEKKRIVTVHTSTTCRECGRESVRDFQEGDTLFAKGSACGCGGSTAIEMIFARVSE